MTVDPETTLPDTFSKHSPITSHLSRQDRRETGVDRIPRHAGRYSRWGRCAQERRQIARRNYRNETNRGLRQQVGWLFYNGRRLHQISLSRNSSVIRLVPAAFKLRRLFDLHDFYGASVFQGDAIAQLRCEKGFAQRRNPTQRVRLEV